MYVKAGTAVTLRCLISNCLEEPAYVFWYHGDRRLLDDDDQIPGDLIKPTTPKPTSQIKTRGKNRRKISAMTQAPELDLDQLFFRGGIKILTQRLVADGSAISTVTIRNPTPAHSGKYTCRPANLEPAFVNLHVIQGMSNFAGSTLKIHTVRKSQILSKNSIFRKVSKLWIWIFMPKMNAFIVMMVHWFLLEFEFSRQKWSKCNIFNYCWFCTYVKSRFLARKPNIWNVSKIISFLTQKFNFAMLNLSENWIFGHNLRFSNSVENNEVSKWMVEYVE